MPKRTFRKKRRSTRRVRVVVKYKTPWRTKLRMRGLRRKLNDLTSAVKEEQMDDRDQPHANSATPRLMIKTEYDNQGHKRHRLADEL